MPFDTVLDMNPYLAPGQTSTQTMELIGIIAHQGTKEQRHYVTITKKGNEWISHNDAIVTQVTLIQLLQTRAYIMIYRKMDHNRGSGTNGPKDSMMVQESTAKKFKLSHKMEHKPEEAPLLPGPLVKLPKQNLPRQLGSNGGDIPQPSPRYGGGLLKKNLEILETLLTNRPNPQAPETRGEGEVGGAVEPDRAPSFEKADHGQPPPAEVGLGQPENENTNFPQTISTFLNLNEGRIEELTSLLSELSGTPLTTEMTCIWLGLNLQSKAIPHDSHIKLIDVLSEDPEDHPVTHFATIQNDTLRRIGSDTHLPQHENPP